MTKRLLTIILAISICFCFYGCKSKDYNHAQELLDQKNYKDAAIIFDSLGDYKDSQFKLKECKYNLALILLDLQTDPLNEAASTVVTTVYDTLASDKDINEAKALLEFVGDYGESRTLLAQLNALQKYKIAISLFEDGNFKEALLAFEELTAIESLYAQRYISAINILSKVSGEWEGHLDGDMDYNDYTSDQLSSGSISCKIGPPYSIGSSWFSDCDWMVNATISLDAGYYVINRGWYENEVSYKTFSRTLQEGFHHSIVDVADALNNTIYIKNENAYDFLFSLRSGIYSRIIISFDSNYSKMTIMEIPFDMYWSKSYTTDSYSAVLTKK